MDMKKILPYQRSLFILGDVGAERYALFRSYSSSNANLDRFWHPEKVIFKQSTWVLFSAEEALCYEWKDNSFRELKNVVAGGTYFISVSPGQLPLNIKLVFPPYSTSEHEFKQYFEQSQLLSGSTTFVWFEGFPYGKADTVQQLRYLQNLGISQSRISIAVTQSEREFVISDIGDMDLGIRNARNYFIEKGYRILKEQAVIPLQRSLLLEAIQHKTNYSHQIVSRKEDVLEDIRASIIFIEDDLQFALENEQWAMKLEDCFAYIYVKNNRLILNVWMKQLKELYTKLLIPILKRELLDTYHLRQIQSKTKTIEELQTVVQVIWNELERRLKTLQKEHVLNTIYLERIAYELETLQMKTKCYEFVNDSIQRRLPKEITRYLDNTVQYYLEEFRKGRNI
ncbi:hypothetical protein [Planococcus sp. ISL-109]|uniref:hypothetical protein n=1 Tax=Planococcus sp. ISL-109 TaxID=2819166 RepID=UPI001BE64870|nr:hypothetical protein [Planococcus sp. ISL-109]MBT2581213.1 hypothetical protein [Planococcus sp. ISL-109]